MFERLKRLYQSGQLTKEAIKVAINKGWINEEQAEQILNLSQEDTIK